MKYFVIADVHGFYTEMKRALDKAGFDPTNPDHFLVSLGDAFDRGKEPKECLEYLLSLNPAQRALVRGNHEDLMEDAIVRGNFFPNDLTNGTMGTALRLTGARNEFEALRAMRTQPLYNAYIRETINYFETKNCVFVHGWIPCYRGIKSKYLVLTGWRKMPREIWQEARWVNGMQAWYDGVIEPHKTIYCGHWHTEWGREVIDKTVTWHTAKNTDFEPWVKKGIVAMDACTVYTGFVNCVVVEDEPLDEEKGN